MIVKNRCSEDFPRLRRFCVFVDRTRTHGDRDELIIFNPYYSTINNEMVPQALSELSAQCLIPMTLDQPITTLTADPTLMTFSFHVESTQEIRLFLHWNGRSIRFYPQDIVEVLPALFSNVRIDERGKRYVNGLYMVRDLGFEHFYRHLSDTDIGRFPNVKKYMYAKTKASAEEKRRYIRVLSHEDAGKVFEAYMWYASEHVLRREVPSVVCQLIRWFYCD